MLARYRIVRGARSPDDPLPDGEREDTRKHTRHVLRPDDTIVRRFLHNPTETEFQRFKRAYSKLLQQRFRSERDRFEALAERARQSDVYIGCNCPTAKQPDVRRCHTQLALEFMARTYPDLKVEFPT